MAGAGALDLIRRHAGDQRANGAVTAALLVELGDRLRQGRLSGDGLVGQWLMVEQWGHERAAGLAGRFVTSLREAQGADPGVPVLDGFDPGPATGRAVGLMRDLGRLDRGQAVFDAAFRRLVEAQAVVADRHVLDAGRRTIEWSSAAAGRRWRRVTGAHPCAFCAMLATRADYRTAESAQYVAGRSHRTKVGLVYTGNARRSRSIGELYHDNCGCTAAEVVGDMPTMPGYDEARDAYDLALEACDEAGEPRTVQNVLRHMRAGGGFHDSPPPATQVAGGAGAGGGGGKPPGRGAGPFRQMGEPPDRDKDKAAWKRYWKDRQDALPLDFKGDQLDPGEIMSYERLLRLGEDIDPIKRRISEPTNDFIWLSHGGIEVEMKGPKTAEYETIMGRIHTAVKSAKDRGFVKDTFLIDIGEAELKQSLAAQLTAYNIDRSKYQIKSLYVMSGDGARIDRINLR